MRTTAFTLPAITPTPSRGQASARGSWWAASTAVAIRRSRRRHPRRRGCRRGRQGCRPLRPRRRPLFCQVTPASPPPSHRAARRHRRRRRSPTYAESALTTPYRPSGAWRGGSWFHSRWRLWLHASSITSTLRVRDEAAAQHGHTLVLAPIKPSRATSSGAASYVSVASAGAVARRHRRQAHPIHP